MTLAEFIAACDALRADAEREVAAASSIEEWTEVRNQLVGRKSGRLTQLMGHVPSLPPEERRAAGQAVNALKTVVDALLDSREGALLAIRNDGRPRDLSLPARRTWKGARHPVSIVVDDIVGIFRGLGFTVALGPEAEWAWYNFGALNFPPNHPAMDMHDTLYLKGDALLRTHTSPVQIRTLQQYEPPIRILAPGNVYRNDMFDTTHAPVFSQLEGMVVDEGVSFADLKATLTHFAKHMFGEGTRSRFVPSYFPFTEPSAQVEVSVDFNDGRGPRWIEIMGSGLMHPAVLEAVGLDSERYTGWAFGMGPGRIAMARYGIPDIRLLYDSDVRFLEQFA
ncbi:MAG TPA: phenylalanine--tRNA ligase subunit alpha [Gemmatimonadaceae bacterium]|nr:phenylalanine--tRNA ligase subunit alpha [Gemmatimonadaceae bacterium]